MDLSSAFEFINECLLYAGTGVFGIAVFIQKGDMKDFIKFVGITSTISAAVLLFTRKRIIKNVGEKSVVFITGCDSGLGFNMAYKCHRMGMTVVAGCHNPKSEGASKLNDLNKEKERMFIRELDVTKEENILATYRFVKDFVEQNGDYEFTALVNNAGVMCFGEFEWQTDEIVDLHVKVNLLGTMKTTKAFLPLLRKYGGRIVNVTSHCGLQALPGGSTYSASKAGLRSWSDALRMEMGQYGVNVVEFIPGGFVMSSNIFARQQEFANEMRSKFSTEQTEFYGKYFEEYMGYLRAISGPKPISDLQNSKMLKTFGYALLEHNPSRVYKVEPFRYTFYHLLFKFTPCFLKDWLVRRFVCFPQYNPEIHSSNFQPGSNKLSRK